jgi:hypothetical protein
VRLHDPIDRAVVHGRGPERVGMCDRSGSRVQEERAAVRVTLSVARCIAKTAPGAGSKGRNARSIGQAGAEAGADDMPNRKTASWQGAGPQRTGAPGKPQ